MLKISFLGAPFVTFADQPAPELNSAPTLLRLFAFLVMHPQPQSRSIVAGAFWPELPEARARRTLNNLIWRLRSALPSADAFLAIDSQTIQFQPQADYWLDVTEFDQRTQDLAYKAANAGQTTFTSETARAYEEALALYRADFLENIDDQWCVAEREQWRERYFGVLERFAELSSAYPMPEQALQAARRLVALDPFRERGQQRLVELYVALGRQAEARAQFEQYVELWQSELHLPPSTDMLKLAADHQLRPGLAAPSLGLPTLHRERPTALPEHPEYLKRQLEICCKNDDLYDLMADRQGQRDNLLKAQVIADKLQEPTAQIDILARRTWLATRQGDYVTALELAQTGLTLCEQYPQTGQRAWLHRLLGVTSEEMGNFKAALHHYTKALQFDEAQRASAFMPANLNNVAATELTLAHYDAARRALERAQTLLVNHPVPRIEVMVIGNLGYAWLKLGDLPKADHYLQQALSLTRQLGERGTEWWLAAVIAKLYHGREETARAVTFALQHYDAASATDEAWVLTYLADALALFYADAQAGEESLAWAQRMQEHAAHKQQWRYQVRSLLRLAQAHQLLAQPAAAFAAIAEAIAQYRSRKQSLEEEPELFATYAQCAAAVGNQLLAVQAQQQAQQALHAQMAAIPDPALRQRFLRVQRLGLK